jgi:two-component system chemotaxis response regulator CheB
VVVIGASAGGLDAVRVLVSGIPATFPSAICIVIHISPESPSVLAEILSRATPLRVSQACDRQRLEAGHVYVAPPDRHLIIEPGRLRVTKGPREHRFRPAIDPMFRSAAQVFGPNAIGIVLTGNLDDGAAGLWTIKKLGGTAIVQDPSEAMFSSMPLQALTNVNVDHVVPLAQIPKLLVELTSGMSVEAERRSVPRHIEVEVNIAKEQNPRDAGLEQIGKPSPYACPECHGVLLEINDDGRIRLRCHTGHAYSLESLLAAINEAIENSMSAAMRSIEEGGLLMKDIATQLGRRNRTDESARMMLPIELNSRPRQYVS